MKGESIKNLDPNTANFLKECLADLANRINCGDKTEFLNFIKGLGNMDQLTQANLVRSYSKKKEVSMNSFPKNVDFFLDPLIYSGSVVDIKIFLFYSILKEIGFKMY